MSHSHKGKILQMALSFSGYCWIPLSPIPESVRLPALGHASSSLQVIPLQNYKGALSTHPSAPLFPETLGEGTEVLTSTEASGSAEPFRGKLTMSASWHSRRTWGPALGSVIWAFCLRLSALANHRSRFWLNWWKSLKNNTHYNNDLSQNCEVRCAWCF